MSKTPIKSLKDEIFLENNTLITSKTDLKGFITYGNDDFVRFSGFSEENFLGKPHNLVRHPDMPRIAFKLLWQEIQNGNEFFAFVKNLNALHQTYWVFANVTPSYDENNNLIGYYSVRRRPSKKGVAFMSGFYKQLCQAEEKGKMEASANLLHQALKDANTTYESLVISLQNTGWSDGFYGDSTKA